MSKAHKWLEEKARVSERHAGEVLNVRNARPKFRTAHSSVYAYVDETKTIKVHAGTSQMPIPLDDCLPLAEWMLDVCGKRPGGCDDPCHDGTTVFHDQNDDCPLCWALGRIEELKTERDKLIEDNYDLKAQLEEAGWDSR